MGKGIYITLLILLSVLAARRTNPFGGIDYFSFRKPVELLRQDPQLAFYGAEHAARLNTSLHEFVQTYGSAQLKSAMGEREVIRMTATPFLYTLLAPFTRGDFTRDFFIYKFFLLLCGTMAIFLLSLLLGWADTGAFVAAVAYVCFCRPFIWDVAVGNVNQIQLLFLALGLVAFAAGFRARLEVSGMLFGLLLAFKPNLLPIVVLTGAYVISHQPLILLRTGWHFALGFVGGILMAITASSLFLGTGRPWVTWASEVFIKLAREFAFPTWGGNSAPAQIIYERTGYSVGPLLFLLGVVIFLALAGRGRNALTAQKENQFRILFLVAALGSALAQLVPNLVWFHYNVQTLPLVFFLGTEVWRHQEGWLRMAFVAAPALILNVGPPYWQDRFILFMTLHASAAAFLFLWGASRLPKCDWESYEA